MVQHRRMHLVCRKSDLDVELLPFTVRIPQGCLQIVLMANKYEPNPEEAKSDEAKLDRAKVELLIEPGEEGGGGGSYELIVDYKLVIDSHEEMVERDRWQSKQQELLASFELDTCKIGLLELALEVRETLAPEDLTIPSSYRSFNVLLSGPSSRSFYVNPNQLNMLGGRIFKEWFERDCSGEQSAVVQSLNVDELETLLRACCCYSTPIVHRRNFDLLLQIAKKEHITSLLRQLESYLVESQCIHPIRKLEYAAEYRMTRLATIVLKSFPNRLARLDSLFGYLAENGESIADVHLNVLEMLEIRADQILI